MITGYLVVVKDSYAGGFIRNTFIHEINDIFRIILCLYGLTSIFNFRSLRRVKHRSYNPRSPGKSVIGRI